MLGGIAVAVVALDQLSKSWVLRELSTHDVDLFWSSRLRLTFNKGIAFSMGGDKGQVISLIALVVVGFVLFTERSNPTRTGAVARGLIVGGAAGNLADRMFRDGAGFMSGRVVDFIDLDWWPVFNLADSAVVVGCGLLVFSILFQAPSDTRAVGDPADGRDAARAASQGEQARD